MAKNKKRSAKSAVKIEMPKAAADVIERELVVRKGVLVDVVGTKKAPDTDGSVILLKRCKHTPRVATPRSRIRCMECRPAWVTKMEKSEREALAAKAAAFVRKYNA